MTHSVRDRIAGIPAALQEQSNLNAVIADISPAALAGLDTAPEGSLSRMLLGIKDNLNLAGSAATCASRTLEGYISTYTATAVQQLLDAGGHLVVKTNMDEFAMGSSSEYSCFGPVHNPHDTDLVPGGSSGGSAVVVATGLVDAALGSDTGGSVRQPAAFCGIYGLKPTYGRVSRYGLVAFASSFDQIGVFARSTAATATVYQAIAGHDARDSTSAPEPVRPFEYDGQRARSLRVGILPPAELAGLDPEILERYRGLIAFMEGEGLPVQEISLPHAGHGIAAYYILTTAEASSNLARFDGIRYGRRLQTADSDLESVYTDSRSSGFGPEVQRRIMLGTYVLSAGYMDKYYGRAQRVRRSIQEDFKAAFTEVDILLTPTTPTFPFAIGSQVNNPLAMYLSDLFTVPMSLAGIPAMSVPVGQGNNGLPIGLQLSAKTFGEESIFQMSQLIENHFQT